MKKRKKLIIAGVVVGFIVVIGLFINSINNQKKIDVAHEAVENQINLPIGASLSFDNQDQKIITDILDSSLTDVFGYVEVKNNQGTTVMKYSYLVLEDKDDNVIKVTMDQKHP